MRCHDSANGHVCAPRTQRHGRYDCSGHVGRDAQWVYFSPTASAASLSSGTLVRTSLAYRTRITRLSGFPCHIPLPYHATVSAHNVDCCLVIVCDGVLRWFARRSHAARCWQGVSNLQHTSDSCSVVAEPAGSAESSIPEASKTSWSSPHVSASASSSAEQVTASVHLPPSSG